MSDADKRARYYLGEIDEDGNPKMPFGFGGGGGASTGGGFGGFRPGGGGGRPSFEDAATADLGDIFEGLFNRGGAASGGFGGRRAPPAKGGDVGYRLAVPFVDAATLKDQRVTLAGGRTIDVKLPAGLEDGTKIRLAGQGDPGLAGPGDAIITVSIAPHRFFRRDGDDIRLDLPITLGEAVLGGKARVPTADGAVALTVPEGSSSGKVLRLKGRGFTRKDGGRGDQLVTLMVDVPAGDAALQAFARDWTGGGDPRKALGV
ncbi:MAG: DnaJ-class molecular chaperone CbpA [uncultured Sphingomonadaceae bacterium]|uniref:DnaJ-class molecular chaperone CbpA n=1 Tax=uncultured Sphingomonadaceae bacterium TaxID=169976 RepID=A0A6J4TX50_9SPHN|nr:MAG: DnaJ-class molecular chaperone CbpA [uncultured Sphingomonadaceae bacterium]